MTQDPLFCESLADALKAVIASRGGSKVVACKLWPEKTPDAAHRNLLDALNENRSEKLCPEQVMFLLRLGRDSGCHAAINYLCRECGYTDPHPIEPEDERAKLMREFIEAQKSFKHMAEKMERLGIVRAA